MQRLNKLGVWVLGITFVFCSIGLYAPHYSVAEHNIGYETLGEYHAAKASDISGFPKFVGLTGIVLLNTISFGMFFDILSKNQKIKEHLDEPCHSDEENEH